MIGFGEWLPDQPAHNNPGLVKAKNTVPGAIGYKPIKSLTAITSVFHGASEDPNIAGIFYGDNSGTVTVFAGNTGSSAKLKKLTSNGTWSAVGTNLTFSVSRGERFKAVQFGSKMVVASGHSQALVDMDLDGANAATISDSGTPSAREIAVVRDFVVCGNLSGATSSVQWSALNDHDEWTAGTDQSDSQAIADSGDVTGLVGGEIGVVFLERGISLMQYVGAPLYFTFDKVSQIGCKYANSIGAISTSQIYFISENGFYVWDGQAARQIGAERVDRFFRNDFDADKSNQITCAVDPLAQTVTWSYASKAATADNDSLIIYNYAVNRWSHARIEHDAIGVTRSVGQDIDALSSTYGNDMDAMGISFDSPSLKGGVFLLCASKNGMIHTFDGEPLECEIETGEVEFARGSQTLVRGVSPYFETADANPQLTVSVGSRSRTVDETTFTSGTAINSDNFVPLRSGGRFHRLNFKLAGNWDAAVGYDLDAAAMGKR